MLKDKKHNFSFMNKEIGNIKKLDNNFFSLSLMWEGMKQTKTLGICFFIFTILASCCVPILKIINFATMSADLVSQQPVSEVLLTEFCLPILVLWIIFPIILVISLFKFMNERAASDFYHSIPSGRTCIYITYSASVFLWGAASISISAVLSYIFYLIAPNYIMIPASFIGSTILVSIITMFLSMSITLLAKGLSGTGFTNVIITVLIMYLPRAFILVFAQSIINAVQVATITGIGFVSPTLNILWFPFMGEGGTLTSSSTLWYSLILGIVYYALGLITHKFRKSETAGKSSSYKCIQHIVRSIFGIIPLIVICFAISSRSYKMSVAEWVIYIAVSVIMYFLYELATTRSGKKLLIAIPMYLIVLGFSFIFVLSSLTISNSIMDDIPEVSDIEYVTLSEFGSSNNMLEKESYYRVKYGDYKFTNQEIIDMLHESLVDNVNIIKDNNESIYAAYDYECETCTVVFHTKSGRNLERNIYINTKKYFDDSEAYGLASYICEDEKYLEIFKNIPLNNEISSKNLVVESAYLDTILNSKISDKDTDELWSTFRTEFTSISSEDKKLLIFEPYSEDGDYAGYFQISGYVGEDYFASKFHINSSLTPKTYSKIADIHNNITRENFKGKIIDTFSQDSEIQIHAGYVNEYFDIERGNTLFYLSNVPEENQMLAEGYFDDLKKEYDYFGFEIKKQYYDDVKEILNIIYEDSKNEFTLDGTYPVVFSICYPVYYDDYGLSYDYTYIYANLSKEQYNHIAEMYEKFSKEGIKLNKY